jgi:hypothetical protein
MSLLSLWVGQKGPGKGKKSSSVQKQEKQQIDSKSRKNDYDPLGFWG